MEIWNIIVDLDCGDDKKVREREIKKNSIQVGK